MHPVALHAAPVPIFKENLSIVLEEMVKDLNLMHAEGITATPFSFNRFSYVPWYQPFNMPTIV